MGLLLLVTADISCRQNHTGDNMNHVPTGCCEQMTKWERAVAATSSSSSVTSGDRVSQTPVDDFVDLAPGIFRQRLVVEGVCPDVISAEDIEAYLRELTRVLEMTPLMDPVTHCSDRYGWAGWVHWENSGAHFYAWDEPIFFSVDIYTCKQFTVPDAVEYTAKTFNASEIQFREF